MSINQGFVGSLFNKTAPNKKSDFARLNHRLSVTGSLDYTIGIADSEFTCTAQVLATR
jgi:hypothetical protein